MAPHIFNSVIVTSKPAAADLSGLQFEFVKEDGSGGIVVCAVQGEAPFGVLQNKPESGESAEVLVLGGTPLKCGTGLAEGALLQVAAAGSAEVAAAGMVVGRVMEATTIADQIAQAIVNCVNPTVV